MTHSSHSSSHNPPAGGVSPPAPSSDVAEMSKALHALVDEDVAALAALERATAQHRPRPVPTAAPEGSTGRGGVANVGPHHPARPQPAMVKPNFSRREFTSPVEQLVEVLEEAYRLRQEVEQVVAMVTGEEAQPIRRFPTMGPVCGLLPNVARIAAEIGAVHGQISERLGRVRERL